MKKLTTLAIGFFIIGAIHAQQIEVVETGSTSSFTDTSYEVLHDFQLTNGFQARRDTEGTFFARIPDLHVLPEPNSVASGTAGIRLTFNDFILMDGIDSKILINSSVSGSVPGTWTRSGRQLNFLPDEMFNGDITVTITDKVSGEYGRWNPQEIVWQFHGPRTLIPDQNFEQALIDQGYDDMLNGWVYTANIHSVTKLNVRSKNISDLTGIEGFVALTSLNCSYNQLTSLDVSANTALTSLYCSYNELTSLDVSNTMLTHLDCANNQLTGLDLSASTDLTYLWCYTNQLTNLDISMNTALTYLNCTSNQLTSLDVSANTALTTLYCHKNTYLSCIQVNEDQLNTTPSQWYKDSFTVYSTACSNISKTYVPDDKFEQALIDLGYDNVLDDSVVTSNIENRTSLSLNYKGIKDLTGIEGFVSLTSLVCHNNQLTSLNVSANTALETLSCSFNQLMSLDISGNTVLSSLSCSSNQLTSLDVSANTALEALYCSRNQLTSLNVAANTSLTTLNCGYNQLSGLDLSTNTALTSLSCYNNQLTSLDVSANTALTYLGCSDNQLAGLDVSANTALTNLYCYKNQLTSLDVSANTALTTLKSIENAYLSCIQVNEDQLNTTPSQWYKDLFTRYSLDCSTHDSKTYVPDDHFEQKLIDLGYDNVLDDSVSSLAIKDVSVLDLSGSGIADLTGIEDFGALTFLNCYNNQLAGLDVSSNTALTYLNCSSNQLTSVDFSKNTELTELICFSNQLTSLDIAANTALTTLHCADNQLTSLDVSANTALEVLFCGQNQLTSLDVSLNTALSSLSCSSNPFTSLDVSLNTALSSLSCSSNQLTSLDVSANTALTYLNCSYNQLTSLDISTSTELENLYCRKNQLTSLDVSANTALTKLNSIENAYLSCIQVNEDQLNAPPSQWFKDSFTVYSTACSNISKTYVPDDHFEQKLIDLGYDNVLDDSISSLAIRDVSVLDLLSSGIANLTGIEDFVALTYLNCTSNQLTSLDLSANIHLTDLHCSTNQLTSLNVSANPALIYLNCTSNQLTSLDVSANTDLRDLYCYYNQLTSLDVSANPAVTTLSCFNNQLTSLDVSANTDLRGLYCHYNQLTSLDLSSNLKLDQLYCRSNQLTSLDVSANTVLTNLNSTSNADLTCIEVNEDQSTSIPTGWTKDSWATYSLDCGTSMRESEGSQLSKEVNTTFFIYPNPARSEVILSLGAPQKVHSIHFTDMAGKLIKAYEYQQKEMSQINLGLEGMTSGLYFVEIVTSGGVMKQRLSVVR